MEDRVVGSFTSVELAIAAELYITQDTTYEVRIEAGENLMDYIRTDVRNGELRIRERHNWVRNRNTIVYVSASFLNGIAIAGSGSVFGTGFTTDDLGLSISGSGDMELPEITATSVKANISGSGSMELEGTTDDLDLEISGSGKYRCRYLPADHVHVSISGSGNAEVTAHQSLSVDISGSGNVTYWGNPATVHSNVSGSGTVVKK